MAIAAIKAITDIRAITASSDIRANCRQYNYYCPGIDEEAFSTSRMSEDEFEQKLPRMSEDE